MNAFIAQNAYPLYENSISQSDPGVTLPERGMGMGCDLCWEGARSLCCRRCAPLSENLNCVIHRGGSKWQQ